LKGIFLFFAVLSLSFSLFAQQNCPTHFEYKDGAILTLDCKGKPVARQVLDNPADKQSPPTLQAAASNNSVLAAKNAEWDAAYIDYQIWALKHSEKLFFWQHLVSQVISFLAFTMVAIGFYYAGVQFKTAQQHASDAQLQHTEIKATLEGFSVKTSALGVVILAMSMAFFFLYLKYVFPITFVSSTPDSHVASEK